MKALTPTALLLLLSLPLTAAAEDLPTLEAFTTQAFPFTGLEAPATQGYALTIYSVDGIAQMEAILNTDLPNDPEKAKSVALQRIQHLQTELKEGAQAAGAGLIQAQHYDLDRLPALVFNGEAIVYGIVHLPAAIARYRQWKGKAGSTP